MRRLDNGGPLRDAMKAAGTDIPRLAATTGLSKALVGFIAGRGKTARDDCSDRVAELIAAALNVPLHTLFEAGSSTPSESTSARSLRTGEPRKKPLPAQLMDQRSLAGFLRKSGSWIDKQIQEDEDWPVHYVGRSRRFDPHEVLTYLDRRHRAAKAA